MFPLFSTRLLVNQGFFLGFFAFVLLLVNSCTHLSSNQSPSHYYEVYDKWSREKKSYEGLQQSMQSLLIVFSPEMARAVNQQKATIYGWGPDKRDQQISQEMLELEKKTSAFLGFYFSQRRMGSLTRKNSPWKIFLDVEGKRFVGEVKKNRASMAELRRLYPDLTNWQTPYYIEFAVPWKTLDGKPFTIHISGPLGYQSFEY